MEDYNRSNGYKSGLNEQQLSLYSVTFCQKSHKQESQRKVQKQQSQQGYQSDQQQQCQQREQQQLCQQSDQQQQCQQREQQLNHAFHRKIDIQQPLQLSQPHQLQQPSQPQQPSPPPSIQSTLTSNQYNIECILSIRYNTVHRLLQYYVKWQGWPLSAATWQPASQLRMFIDVRMMLIKALEGELRVKVVGNGWFKWVKVDGGDNRDRGNKGNKGDKRNKGVGKIQDQEKNQSKGKEGQIVKGYEKQQKDSHNNLMSIQNDQQLLSVNKTNNYKHPQSETSLICNNTINVQKYHLKKIPSKRQRHKEVQCFTGWIE